MEIYSESAERISGPKPRGFSGKEL